MNHKNHRRQFLKTSFGAAAGAVLLTATSKEAMAQSCGLTPPQTSGPFYPGEKNFTGDNDLTRIPGSNQKATGQVIYIYGQVIDQNCQPVVNANVELWQAGASGSYKNSKDPNPAPLDPNFQYWSEVFTDQEGRFHFKSIIPGAYPAAEGWDRPPHLHFRVMALGYHELITQTYFKGDPLNDKDLILNELKPEERARVIVDYRPSKADLEPGSLSGGLIISIRKI